MRREYNMRRRISNSLRREAPSLAAIDRSVQSNQDEDFKKTRVRNVGSKSIDGRNYFHERIIIYRPIDLSRYWIGKTLKEKYIFKPSINNYVTVTSKFT